MPHRAQPIRSVGSPNWIRIGASIALAIVVAVAVWLVLRDAGGGDKPAAASSTASAATLGTLRALPHEVGHDVYWAGPRASYTYELTEVDGTIVIRYLPPGIAVGDPRPDYLTISTSAAVRPYGVLRRERKQPGNTSRRVPAGAIATWSADHPERVNLAFRRSNVLIQVYDPSVVRAQRLATSGAVKPIR
jgi:hypothetical protein